MKRSSVFSRKFIVALLLFTLLLTVAFLPLCKITVNANGVESNYGDGDNKLLADYRQILHNNDSGLPAEEVNCVLQASSGYIWVASSNGLYRYDGRKFQHITDDNMAISQINTICEDKSGNIWIGTAGKGVFVYDNNEIKSVDNIAKLNTSKVNKIIKDNLNRIIIASTIGVVVVEGTGYRVFDSKDFSAKGYNVGRDDITYVAVDKNDNIWGLIGDNYLFCLNKTLQEVVFMKEFLTDEDKPRCLAVNGGNIYIGSASNYMYYMSITETVFNSERRVYTGNVRYINDIYFNSNEQIMICGNNGIGYIQDEKFYILNTERFNNSVKSCTQDREGNYWFSSLRQGVLQLVRSKFTSYKTFAGVNADSINCTMIYNGKLYVGTNNGVIIVEDGKCVESQVIKDNTYGKSVSGLEIMAGQLIIGTNNGLYAYFNDSITEINFYDAIGNDFKVVKKLDGLLYCGTSKGLGVFEYKTDAKVWSRQRSFTTDFTIPVVLCVEKIDGNIYVGTDGGGLYSIEGTSAKNMSIAYSDLSGVILEIVADPIDSSAVWISKGSDLYYWKRGVKPTLIDNVYNDTGSIVDIKFIGEGSNCDIWLLKSTGVYIAKRKDVFENEQDYDYTMLRKRDGLSEGITQYSESYFDKAAGVLYLCSGFDVNSIDINNIHSYNKKPVVVVNSIIVDGKAYPIINNSVSIPSNSKNITISYSLLSFTSRTGEVTYQFKGIDSAPKTLLTDDIVELHYMNLRGGKYTFVLSGVNPDGVNADEITISINKKLSLVEQAWFLVVIIFLGVVALSFLVFMFINMRIKKIEKQKVNYRLITDQALRTIATTIDAKDHYTDGHSKRVAVYCVKLSRHLNLSTEEEDDLYYSALLHDIGKIGVPDSVLNKPGPLTDEERKIVNQHPVIGGKILKQFTAIKNVMDGAVYHHERYDGKGYNKGLKGEEIPLAARIIGIADAVDAMRTTRSYRERYSDEKIISELRSGNGTQFDPNLVEHMIEIIGDADNIVTREKE